MPPSLLFFLSFLRNIWDAEGTNDKAGLGRSLVPDGLGQSPERIKEKPSTRRFAELCSCFRSPRRAHSRSQSITSLLLLLGLPPMSQAQTGTSPLAPVRVICLLIGRSAEMVMVPRSDRRFDP